MNMTELKPYRDSAGRFVAGNPGGPGRQPRATEIARLAIVNEVAGLKEWRQIVERAVKDAIHGRDGKTREYGRRFIAEYLIGRPAVSLHVSAVRLEDDPYQAYAHLTDEELQAIASGEDDDEDDDEADSRH